MWSSNTDGRTRALSQPALVPAPTAPLVPLSLLPPLSVECTKESAGEVVSRAEPLPRRAVLGCSDGKNMSGTAAATLTSTGSAAGGLVVVAAVYLHVASVPLFLPPAGSYRARLTSRVSVIGVGEGGGL